MRRLFLTLLLCLTVFHLASKEMEVIFQGPKEIGDWGTVELSSIQFHNLEMGDTIYVFTSMVDSTSLGSFQDHNWHTIAGVINGQAITGDFEFVVKSEEMLNELKQYGLKVRGFNYTLDKVVIKPQDNMIQTILIISGSVIFLLILMTIAILVWKNKQLQKAYCSVYQRNLDVVAAADNERRIRAHYEGQIEAFKEMILTGMVGSAARQKYQNSNLADDDKEILINRILKLFEDTDEIYAEDFNMQKLASLVASNYNNVSQVINERMGKNFNQLLNEYRINEACRRFNNVAKFGNFTIEAIGNSVGYGSRSTFITQFKAFTGMTPSEFQNMARQIR